MLSFSGGTRGFCDGAKRRDFLKVGALAMGGLTLPRLLQAEAAAGEKATGRSIINIFLSGGPSHMDTFDLKPNAPVEFRGEFRPITTNVPGFEFCEHMPILATMADRITAVRFIVGMNDEHTNVQSDTGWPQRSLDSIGGRPSVGAVMSRLFGPAQVTPEGNAPTFVDLTGGTNPGFLGQVHAGYRPDGEGRQNLTLNSRVSRSRLEDRRSLLTSFDRMRRDVDNSGMMNALDIQNEDPRRVARYGINERRENERFLLARRLISAGSRCVSFSWGGWDTHERNFITLKTQLPALDTAMSALIEDLDAHGQLENTIILMSGEFGRTPRVNGNAGRDHWSRAAFMFMAGGGMRHGRFIGSTNRLGEYATDRPVHLQHVFTTVYKQLGIDPAAITLTDPNGRPQYLVENREVISELV